MKANLEQLVKLLRDSYDLQEEKSEKTAYWHLQHLRSEIKQLTLTDVVDSKRFTETDLLNGYQAGCIEGLDDCCDLGLDDLKEIKEDGEKWVKIYTE